MVEQFSLHWRVDPTAPPPDPSLTTVARVTSAFWDRVLGRVRAAVDDALHARLGYAHSLVGGCSASVSFLPGWVCLRVTHPWLDAESQVVVMRVVALVVGEHMRQ